jgi:hypothetical protein
MLALLALTGMIGDVGSSTRTGDDIVDGIPYEGSPPLHQTKSSFSVGGRTYEAVSRKVAIAMHNAWVRQNKSK